MEAENGVNHYKTKLQEAEAALHTINEAAAVVGQEYQVGFSLFLSIISDFEFRRTGLKEHNKSARVGKLIILGNQRQFGEKRKHWKEL